MSYQAVRTAGRILRLGAVSQMSAAAQARERGSDQRMFQDQR
jgi:hypothetical protein